MIVRATASRIEVWAPAKLNLFLEIQGKRSDGYHEIQTLMVPIALYDTLLISPTEPADAKTDILLTIDGGERGSTGSGDAVPASAENTVLKAVAALRQQTDFGKAGLTIRLIKRIPAAAGLAGGSSDAAAALVGVAKALQLDVTDAQLHGAAANVGSDVPFFLGKSAAVCGGRGEQVVSCPLSRLHFVIAKPLAGLSTAQVYGACKPEQAAHPVAELADALRRRDPGAVRARLFNGLQPAAAQLCPEIEHLQREFGRQDLIAHQMSGSGTSYFGICATAKVAQRVAARLRAREVGRVFAVSSCL